jgi:hypothetical protein
MGRGRKKLVLEHTKSSWRECSIGMNASVS